MQESRWSLILDWITWASKKKKHMLFKFNIPFPDRNCRDPSLYIDDPVHHKHCEQIFWEYNSMDTWQACYVDPVYRTVPR